MLYICTATYFEAEAIIDAFALKKVRDINYADVYEGDTAVLIVSGVGGVYAAVKAARFLQTREISSGDVFVNAGICGCSDGSADVGTLFAINKICSSYTSRCFYPDILYTHDFEEASLMTYPEPHRGSGGEYRLSDMEAAEIFLAASEFFTLERIVFLKIVSDINSPETVTREMVSSLMRNEKLITFLKSLCRSQNTDNTAEISAKYTARFSHMLLLTETMKNELSRMINYYILSGGDISVLEGFSAEKPKDKRSAKKIFGMLKNILLSE